MQGYTLAPYLFIICPDYALWVSIILIKRKLLYAKKAKSRRYLTETKTSVDYADDLTLLANTPDKTESLLHKLENTTGGTCTHVNTNITEYMCFKWEWAISILSGKSLGLVDKFWYLGSNITSTESDVSIRVVKAWNAIDKLLIIQ